RALCLSYIFFSLTLCPPSSTLFPYTTLFRSSEFSSLNKSFSERRLDLITGIHHISAFTKSAQINHHYYTDVLGLRFVKNTVNQQDRKSTRLNSSHVKISYAVFCLKKKKKNTQ